MANEGPKFFLKNPLNECVETIFFQVEQMRNPNKPPPQTESQKIQDSSDSIVRKSGHFPSNLHQLIRLY